MFVCFVCFLGKKRKKDQMFQDFLLIYFEEFSGTLSSYRKFIYLHHPLLKS